MPVNPKTFMQLVRGVGTGKTGQPSPRKRGYTRDWEKASKQFLRDHPLCIYCQQEGVTTAATVVDHRVPHRGNLVLFWDEKNWDSCCKRHHDRKTRAGR